MNKLARLLEKMRLKEEKKKERELKKKEREEKKKNEKKISHHKKQRKKFNHKYYLKRRKQQLQERKMNGDIYGYHMVVLTKNKKRYKRIGCAWWKNEAIKIYENAIEDNQKNILFPVRISENHKINNFRNMEYEILLVKRINEGEDNVRQFRDKNGQFVDNVIVDNSNYVIIAKHEWLIEETFNVYGYHPLKDRKTFSFILNDIILKDISRNNIKRIFTHQNKLFIQYNEDFDFITCKNKEECLRLYNELQKNVKKNKYIIFTGELNSNYSSWIIDKLQEKTGRSRAYCRRSTTR